MTPPFGQERTIRTGLRAAAYHRLTSPKLRFAQRSVAAPFQEHLKFCTQPFFWCSEPWGFELVHALRLALLQEWSTLGLFLQSSRVLGSFVLFIFILRRFCAARNAALCAERTGQFNFIPPPRAGHVNIHFSPD